MTSQPDFLLHLTGALDKAQVPYMLTGSVASSLYGEPRATRDLDVVVALTRGQIEAVLDALSKGCYISRAAAHEALVNASSFNVIEIEAGWKADLIVRKDRPFSLAEFARRRKASVLGLQIWVATPEDIILSKLAWGKQSGSEMQVRDALGVAAVQYESLDRDYLRQWAMELDVADDLARLLDQAKQERDRQEDRG